MKKMFIKCFSLFFFLALTVNGFAELLPQVESPIITQENSHFVSGNGSAMNYPVIKMLIDPYKKGEKGGVIILSSTMTGAWARFGYINIFFPKKGDFQWTDIEAGSYSVGHSGNMDEWENMLCASFCLARKGTDKNEVGVVWNWGDSGVHFKTYPYNSIGEQHNYDVDKDLKVPSINKNEYKFVRRSPVCDINFKENKAGKSGYEFYNCVKSGDKAIAICYKDYDESENRLEGITSSLRLIPRKFPENGEQVPATFSNLIFDEDTNHSYVAYFSNGKIKLATNQPIIGQKLEEHCGWNKDIKETAGKLNIIKRCGLNLIKGIEKDTFYLLYFSNNCTMNLSTFKRNGETFSLFKENIYSFEQDKNEKDAFAATQDKYGNIWIAYHSMYGKKIGIRCYQHTNDEGIFKEVMLGKNRTIPDYWINSVFLNDRGDCKRENGALAILADPVRNAIYVGSNFYCKVLEDNWKEGARVTFTEIQYKNEASLILRVHIVLNNVEAFSQDGKAPTYNVIIAEADRANAKFKDRPDNEFIVGGAFPISLSDPTESNDTKIEYNRLGIPGLYNANLILKIMGYEGTHESVLNLSIDYITKTVTVRNLTGDFRGINPKDGKIYDLKCYMDNNGLIINFTLREYRGPE